MQAVTQKKAEIGARIKLVIQASGLTVKEWAARYGLKNQRVTEWIKGRNLPDVAVMMVICNAEGLTLDWIYFGVMRSGVSATWADHLLAPKPESAAKGQTQERLFF